MTRVGYWLRTALHLPIYFYCRYSDYSPNGCFCYMERTGKRLLHDSPSGHPICRHCTDVPTVRCRACGVEYFDSIPPRPEVWEFSLWKGWRHRACQ